jgi:uncharacterized membrane protein YraQ (UPF0718 family)
VYLSPDFVARARGAADVFIATLSGLAFETIPFLLVGTLLSAAIQDFVPDRVIRKLFPKNRYLSILVALGLGAFLPICECATVPLAQRLRQKGLPLSTAVAFLLAAPIVNPMTVISTYLAFRGTGRPVYLQRLGFGLAASFIVAVAVELATSHGEAGESAEVSTLGHLLATKKLPATFLPPSEVPARKGRLGTRIIDVIEHASYEFLDLSRYLIAGISIAALVRACLPMDAAAKALGTPLAATGAGLGAAYVLSLCSSADAFVARSMFGSAPYASILGFLVLGPMLDLKNTILLARFVRPGPLSRFVLLVFLAAGSLVLLVAPFLGAI